MKALFLCVTRENEGGGQSHSSQKNRIGSQRFRGKARTRGTRENKKRNSGRGDKGCGYKKRNARWVTKKTKKRLHPGGGILNWGVGGKGEKVQGKEKSFGDRKEEWGKKLNDVGYKLNQVEPSGEKNGHQPGGKKSLERPKKSRDSRRRQGISPRPKRKSAFSGGVSKRKVCGDPGKTQGVGKGRGYPKKKGESIILNERMAGTKLT